jgi:hypothetical protein
MDANRRRPCFAALAAGLLLLAAPSRPSSAQTPSGPGHSPCTSGTPTVQAPAPGGFQVAGGFAFPPTLLDSLADAAAQYDMTLLLPTAVSDGYSVGGIEYTHSTPPIPQVDQLTICYFSADHHYLEIEQGVPAPKPGGPTYIATPDGDKGTTTAEGQTAYWNLGELTETGIQTGRPTFTWQPGPPQLTWSTNVLVPRPPGALVQFPGGQPMPPPPLYAGYELDSDSLSLDDLLAIAKSVEPYRPDADSVSS